MDTFSVGEIVDVRNYGRAQVIEPLVSDPAARFLGRIRVKYQVDGKTYYARPENLRKTVQVKQRVLLCHSTTHYRTCAASIVNWNDAVLEVGSHEGECTWLLSRRCRYIVGVDKSATVVEAARRRYPGLRFEAVDGFDVPALKALAPPDGDGFSVVLVDIGGIASLSTVAALVGLYYKEFPYTTKIVVKSVFLKRMVENCLPYNTEKSNPWAMLGGGAAQAGDSGPTAEDDLREDERGDEVPGDGSSAGPAAAGLVDGPGVARGSAATSHGEQGGKAGGKPSKTRRGRRGRGRGRGAGQGGNTHVQGHEDAGAEGGTEPGVGSKAGAVEGVGQGIDGRVAGTEGPSEGTQTEEPTDRDNAAPTPS